MSKWTVASCVPYGSSADDDCDVVTITARVGNDLSLSTLWERESAQSLQRSMFAAQFVQHGDVRGKRVTAGECVVPPRGRSWYFSESRYSSIRA